ncbi:MAG: tRNA guanosine(15) transglycosylase TgtA [Thermoplasmatales archaeon]|nr:tRNA guanosine(15) transglycosylase TgtA [Thermoplasmatales archaeon]
MFELKEMDGLARIGKFYTKHGVVETPALLPVINPNYMLISPNEMKEKFKAEMLITNSYIIYKKNELREKALKNGVHSLLGFDGPVMTDSGSFQMYVYGDVEIENREIVDFQKKIGSDVSTILDIISPPDRKYEDAKKDVEETIKRAKEVEADALTVQGSVYPDLREYCATELSKLDCILHPVGSVVPLMEKYRFSELVDVIVSSKKGLIPSRPVHLFGCGHPMIFPVAVLLGCDLFDSSSYAKYARHNRMMFPDGTKNVDEMKYPACPCPGCSNFDEIKEMNENEKTRKIAEHNLYVSFSEIKKIKQAVHEGGLWEMVEERCRAHPFLLSALKKIGEHKEFLERFEPVSRKSFFYTGKASLSRPIVYRFRKRIFERYEKPEADILVVLPESERPYSKTYHDVIKKISEKVNAHFVVNSVFGPVPVEFDEMYPVGQSVVPMDVECEKDLVKEYVKTFDYPNVLFWENEKTFEKLESFKKKSSFNADVQKIKSVAFYQFGKCPDLFKGKIKLVKSKNGKIRNVFVDGEHILSVRNDGFFTLKMGGAKKLHSILEYPKMRVAVNDDAVAFIMEGKNVFSKFVVECDPEIRPKDEVLIVDKNDILIGVGRATMNREEMLSFKKGIAVKVR